MAKVKHEYETKQLKQIAPQEWVRRINTLPAKIRDEAACIIWWDHFSGRLVGEAWSHLNGYLTKRFVSAPRIQLVNALIKCGYPEVYANKRIK